MPRVPDKPTSGFTGRRLDPSAIDAREEGALEPRVDLSPIVAEGAHDLAAIQKSVALINGGKTPAQIDAARNPAVRDPGHAIAPPLRGYAWDPAALARVLAQTGVADAKAVIETAIAMDQDERYLDAERLLEAARRGVAHVTSGVKWSPGVLADVMKKTGVAEETALLRMAKRLVARDADGNRMLTEADLLRAAQIVSRVVDAHDYVGILRALDALRGRDDVQVATLGATEGLPIDVVRFPAAKQPPAMRVLVTGGVHGDEPCGAASALLLVEQLAANPAMRQDIEWVVVPVVNPRALVSGTRETPDEIDLNREFEDDPNDPLEVDVLQALFAAEPELDLALDLHSGQAKRNGFWVIQQSKLDHDDIAPGAVRRFSTEWPVLHGDSDPYTLLEPGVASSKNPGTLKGLAIEHGARWAATVEAPGSISYREQVLGENDVVHQMVLEARRRLG